MRKNDLKIKLERFLQESDLKDLCSCILKDCDANPITINLNEKRKNDITKKAMTYFILFSGSICLAAKFKKWVKIKSLAIIFTKVTKFQLCNRFQISFMISYSNRTRNLHSIHYCSFSQLRRLRSFKYTSFTFLIKFLMTVIKISLTIESSIRWMPPYKFYIF